MNSKEVKYLTEAYSNVYSESQNNCQELYDSLLELCVVDGGFTTLEECEDFAEFLVADNLVEDFIVTLLEYYEVENLNESLNFLGENRAAALRAVINALSSGGRLKAGLKPLTALGRRPETVVKGAAASTSIRSARAQRSPVVPEQPGKYLELMRNRTPPTSPVVSPSRPQTPPLSIFTVKPKRTGAPEPAFDKFQSSLTKKPDWMKYQDKYQQSQRPASDRSVQARVAAQKDKLGAAGILGALGTTGVLSGVNSIPNSTKKDPNLSVGKFNTMDPSGKIRDRKVLGPKELGPKKVGTVSQAFDASYSSAKKSGLKSFDFQGKKYTTESFDSYDIILSHLINEGYADTIEEAELMMVNMSEDWRQSIVEGGV